MKSNPSAVAALLIPVAGFVAATHGFVLETGVPALVVLTLGAGPLGTVLGIHAWRRSAWAGRKTLAGIGLALSLVLTALVVLFLLTFEPS
jgi:hypothetical protein